MHLARATAKRHPATTYKIRSKLAGTIFQGMTTARIVHAASPANRSYCLNLMRSYDNENFIANLLHPNKASRPSHAALRAFNIELANIRTSVSNEDIGRLRIQFFRDGLNAILSATTVPASPVLDCLAETVDKNPHVDFARLHVLVDAREKDLAYPSFAALSDLEHFARDTHGTLAALHASILAPDVSDVDHIVDKAGVAIGLAVLLRGAPAHASARLSYIPRELIQRYHLSHHDLLSGDGMAPQAFKDVAKRAEELLDDAKLRLSSTENRRVRPAFWPLQMAHIYLRRLQKADYNPFDERLQGSIRATYPLALQLRLLQCRLFRR